MKRLKIILPVLVALAFLFYLLSLPDHNVPRYVAITTQPAGPFSYENYGFNDTVPFRDGKFWLNVRDSNGHGHIFLYDLDRGRVVSELLHAVPAMANGDQTLLLCEGPGPFYYSIEAKGLAMLNKVSRGRIPLMQPNRVETFWILDLRNNSAVKLGGLPQLGGYGSSWGPAPGYRFAINQPSGSKPGEFYLCDLDQKTLQKISLTSATKGWWDDHQLVVQDVATNLFLFDVVNRRTNALLAGAAITRFLHEQGVPYDSAGLATHIVWNGSNYDLYLSANRVNGLVTNATYLISVNHADAALKLLYTNISFRWSSRLDASATHLLYQGESGGSGTGGNGGVYLRDLTSLTERTLVPPDNRGPYSLARQYLDTVVFWRSNVLWRVDINTTNATRLFPPPGR